MPFPIVQGISIRISPAIIVATIYSSLITILPKATVEYCDERVYEGVLVVAHHAR
jgi:hypothetical protein